MTHPVSYINNYLTSISLCPSPPTALSGKMGSGWAVAVTVVGSFSIVGLLGLLGRYLGVWSWARAVWVRAGREEKAHLCRSQRSTTSARSYLVS